MNKHFGIVRASATIFLSSLCIMLLPVFAVPPCFGEPVDSKPPGLSLKVTNLPLTDVLKTISDETGRQIIVNPPWGKVALSLNFKDISLEEAIRAIIQALGRPNHFIVTNEKDKKVTLLISGLPTGGANRGNELAASMGNQTPSPADKGAVFSSDSQKGSLRPPELEAMNAKLQDHWKNLPKDTVIGPPSTSGGPGLTIEQLEAIKKEQEKRWQTLPHDTIIGPPSTSGGPGLTMGQLETIKEQQGNQRQLGQDSVIGPPSMSGGPGLTFGQLEAVKKEYKQKRKAQPAAMKIKGP